MRLAPIARSAALVLWRRIRSRHAQSAKRTKVRAPCDGKRGACAATYMEVSVCDCRPIAMPAQTREAEEVAASLQRGIGARRYSALLTNLIRGSASSVRLR